MKLTDASRGHARILSMDLAGHPLAIDDELVSRPANTDLGDVPMLDRVGGHRRINGGVRGFWKLMH